jgi:23S rRNA (cytidine1920-2'-O)/16S rRNA (cytidine1409-2'-O)-methyltransferase
VAERRRLDTELVRRGMARSREHAADLVVSGRVRVAGRPHVKPATAVETSAGIAVVGEPTDDYASRGAHKLAGALDTFGPRLDPAGRRCLDAGASTGGFTDVLLRRGAAVVYAVDVGYGQLDLRLRRDPRVVVLDRTNVRGLTPDGLDGQVDLVVADLSFISLRLVLPALIGCVRADGDLLLMVKPQFEVGRHRLGSGGVVRDPQLRAWAVQDVADAAGVHGWGTAGVTASPLPGPSGNVEYFVWLRRDAPALRPEQLRRAIEEGPT